MQWGKARFCRSRTSDPFFRVLFHNRPQGGSFANVNARRTGTGLEQRSAVCSPIPSLGVGQHETPGFGDTSTGKGCSRLATTEHVHRVRSMASDRLRFYGAGGDRHIRKFNSRRRSGRLTKGMGAT